MEKKKKMIIQILHTALYGTVCKTMKTMQAIIQTVNMVVYFKGYHILLQSSLGVYFGTFTMLIK